LRANTAKEKLKQGKFVIGALLPFYSPAAVEILGYAGCDFVTFDSEHGPLTPIEMENMARAANCAGVIPLGRVESNAQSTILRILDSGVMGVQVPHICTRTDAEAAVHAVKYHPLGERGLAGSVRAAGYSSIPSGDYVKESNKNSMVII
jgi:4-hydroxy-2-oxoheptanedioate aldolase